jgi:hypothetical protein
MKLRTLKNLILLNGIENNLFMVPMQPLRRFLGIGYKSSSDESFIVPCKITEKRYKISDDYKISLESIIPGFGIEHYYICDLEKLIIEESVKIFVRQKLVEHE